MKRQNNGSKQSLLWEGQPIVLVRSARRTVGLEINREMRVLVRAPLCMSEDTILHFVESKGDWLREHMERLRTQMSEADDLPPFTREELAALLAKAKAQIPPRVREVAAQMGVNVRRITVRLMVSRFGSCTARGDLSFNALLAAMPQEICDYVIVHELCHRREMNHSAAFWREVEKVLPDERERRRWLRQHGPALIERLRRAHNHSPEGLCVSLKKAQSG